VFRDSDQQHGVCRALVALAGKPHLWDVTSRDSYLRGPTEALWHIVERRPGAKYASSGAELLVRIALDVWNGQGGTQLGRALNVLDNRHLRAVGELLVAIATDPSAIDRWIETYQPEES
jgi:hypothetical protein